MEHTRNGVKILWLCGYRFYFNRDNRYTISSKLDTLEEKYIRLKNIILKAKELKK
jgi:hypothetical protein